MPSPALPRVDDAAVREAAGEGYRVAERIGTGPFGAVYRAHDVALDRDVALKVLVLGQRAAAAHERLTRTAELVGELSHPGVIAPMHVAQHGEMVLYAMPLVEGGGSVEALLHSDRLLPFDRIIGILGSAAAALDHAHAHAVVHGGVKPANLLIGERGTALVSDFGVATALSAIHALTGANGAGTQAYAAPEQRRGHVVDRRADQYALAVVAYELITGQRRLDAPAVEGIQTVDPVEVLADVPLRKGLGLHANAALRKALSANPEARFSSATAFVEALSGKVSEEAPGLPTVRPHFWLPATRRATAVVVAVIVVAVLVVVINPQTAASARQGAGSLLAHVRAWLPGADLHIGDGSPIAAGSPGGGSGDLPMPHAAGTDLPPTVDAPSSGAPDDGRSTGERSALPTSATTPGSGGAAAAPVRSVSLDSLRRSAGTAAQRLTSGVQVREPSIPSVTLPTGQQSRTPAHPVPEKPTSGVARAQDAAKGFFARLASKVSAIVHPDANTGAIQVTASQGTALVMVDGVPRGTTPQTVYVSPGQHTVWLESATGTYVPSRATVTVGQGGTVVANFTRAATGQPVP